MKIWIVPVIGNTYYYEKKQHKKNNEYRL